MEDLLDILEDIKPGIDYETCTTLIDDGLLDSFDIISLIQEVNDAFDIEVPAAEIVPANFNSAAALWQLIEKLLDE